MLDVAFAIETDMEDWWDIPESEIAAALLSRISSLLSDESQCFKEAFGHCDTYEIDPVKVKGSYSEQIQNELEPIEETKNES